MVKILIVLSQENPSDTSGCWSLLGGFQWFAKDFLKLLHIALHFLFLLLLFMQCYCDNCIDMHYIGRGAPHGFTSSPHNGIEDPSYPGVMKKPFSPNHFLTYFASNFICVDIDEITKLTFPCILCNAIECWLVTHLVNGSIFKGDFITISINKMSCASITLRSGWMTQKKT